VIEGDHAGAEPRDHPDVVFDEKDAYSTENTVSTRVRMSCRSAGLRPAAGSSRRSSFGLAASARDFETILSTERKIARHTFGGIQEPHQIQAIPGEPLTGIATAPGIRKRENIPAGAALLIPVSGDHDVFKYGHVAEQALVLERACQSAADDLGRTLNAIDLPSRRTSPASAR
jgi:hypothetical protein